MVSTDERPVTLDKVRVQRQLRELAVDHAEGRIGDEAYMAQVKELRRKLATFKEPTSGQVPAQHATEWLRALGETLRAADVPEAKSDLLHAIYERIAVAGPEFVTAYLTPAAYAHGLAALLLEVVMAPPAGFEPATGRLEGGCSSPLSYGGATGPQSTHESGCWAITWSDYTASTPLTERSPSLADRPSRRRPQPPGFVCTRAQSDRTAKPTWMVFSMTWTPTEGSSPSCSLTRSLAFLAPS